MHETTDNIVPISHMKNFVNAMRIHNPSVDIVDNYHSEYNQYPTQSTIEQATHVFKDPDILELVQSYFYSKCMTR